MKRAVVLCALIVLVLAAPVLAQAPANAPKSEAPELSEVQKLKADVLKLRAEVAALRATVADREKRLAEWELNATGEALAKDFLKTLKAPDGATWDWATMSVKLPEPPAKKEQ